MLKEKLSENFHSTGRNRPNFGGFGMWVSEARKICDFTAKGISSLESTSLKP